MLLTKSEFNKKRENNSLNIAFIGMSNAGKSFRSHEMEKYLDFNALHVDSEIEKDLALKDMREMAKWMGYPFENHYEKRSKKYLELEKKHTKSANITSDKNFVLDTTGSVIYHTNETYKFLQENFLIVLLDTPEERVLEMEKQFFLEPKSVYWGNSFSITDGENQIDALRRSYPQLLHDRISMYREWADIVIPAEISRYEGLSIERFLEIITFSLPEK